MNYKNFLTSLVVALPSVTLANQEQQRIDDRLNDQRTQTENQHPSLSTPTVTHVQQQQRAGEGKNALSISKAVF